MNVTLRGVKLRGVLPRPTKSHQGPSEGFEGRWLVIAASGECLMDYVHGACDVERELPLANLCSLATAMTQFIDTACRQAQGVMTHAVTFDSFLLAICAGHNLSVLAVVATPKAQAPASSTAVLRYKAMEIQAALSRGALGVDFQKLVGASLEARAEKVSDYTLSSCLAEDDSSMRLPKELASAAQEEFAKAFGRSYRALLGDALEKLEPKAREAVRCLCLFDSRFEFLALWPEAKANEDGAVELLRCSAEAAGAAAPRGSVWAWQTAKLSELAVLNGLAQPVLVAALVELEETGSMVLSSAGSMVRCVLPEEIELHQRTAAVASVLEWVAKQLCDSFGLETPDPKSCVVVESLKEG